MTISAGRRAARRAGPCVLAAVMVLVAGVLERRALLFPEAVALAYGVWTLRRAAWARPVPLVLVPTACAVLGLACAHGPGPRWVWAAVAVLGALLVLHLARSPLIPALSAAVLPVVFGIADVEYPLAVLVWCLVLALPIGWRRRPPGPPGPPAGSDPRWPVSRVVAFATTAVAWIAVAALAGLPALVTAPPLLVAGLEHTVRDGAVWGWALPRRVLLMVVAGALGGGGLALGLPGWSVAGVGVALVIALASLLREPLTPATALVLVPFVAGVADPLLTAAAFAAGGVVLQVVPALVSRLIARLVSQLVSLRGDP